MVIGDTNHILFQCHTLKEKHEDFMKKINKELKADSQETITSWFDASLNMYDILDKVEEEEEEQQIEEPERKQKRMKQTTLFQKDEPPTKEDEARKTLKRKKIEANESKGRIKIIKKKRLADKSMGNLGFVNKCLLDQIQKNIKSEKEKKKYVLRAQELLIDHLMEIYKTFWKDHIEKIIETGIEESSIKIFNRGKAVT